MGMNTDLPIFMLDITDDINDDAQVDFIALVDRPAIQKNWNAFNKSQKFEIVNEERRIISGAIMLADTPIFRSDSTYGDYYVAFSKDTILKIVQKFFKKGFQSNVNLMHDSTAQFSDITLFESFISDPSRGIMPMKGFEDAPVGSWFGSMIVDNEEAWTKVKNGEILGFSVEGLFNYKPREVNKVESMVDAIKKILSQVK
jgi:hypothetical protein